MSGLEGLQLDHDGFVDMDQFPDDGTDLGGADLEQLRAVLHADPVEEPTPEQWDAIFDDAIGADGDAGPFALDDVDGPVPDGADVGDASEDGAGGLALDEATNDDHDTDPDVEVEVDLAADVDGGLDLTTDHGLDDIDAPDDSDGAADGPTDFEDLL